MTAIVVGLLLVIGVALGIIVLVALPHVRDGAPLLTAEGERLAAEARRRAEDARRLAAAAAERARPPAQSRPTGATPPPGTPVVDTDGAAGGQEEPAGRR